VERTINRMEEQLHTPISVADLADAVGLSVSQLTRLFRAETTCTPGAYLRQLRMDRAKILIERSSLSITDVMRQVGIHDPSHFARDFRRTFGIGPRELRRLDSPACGSRTRF
jgi:transcriptional regulator GlxA family with amidase domain